MGEAIAVGGLMMLVILTGWTLAFLLGWMAGGLFGLRSLVVTTTGRRYTPRAFAGYFVMLCYSGFYLWVAAATELAMLGAVLGATAIVALLFMIALPLWSIKNVLLGPHRVWGAVCTLLVLLLSYPLLSTGYSMRGFLSVFVQVLQGRAELTELLWQSMELWSRAFGL